MAEEDIKHFLELDEDGLAGFIANKVHDYYRFLSTSGQLDRIRDLFLMYHGYDRNSGDHATSDIIFAGEQSEVTLIKSNHIRNLLQHTLALTTGQRPAFEPIASNSTAEAYEAVGLAKDVLQYYSHETERVVKLCAEYAWVTSEGFLLVEWDPYAGRDTGTGEVLGDLVYTPLSALDVIKDPKKPFDGQPWAITRKAVNRFDLAAEFPEHREYILNLGSADHQSRFDTKLGVRMCASYLELSDEDIYLYTMFHNRTPAVPDGAMAMYIDGKMIMMPEPLPYRRIPLLREVAGDFLQTSMGYSPGFDLMGQQEAYDSLLSTALTNLTAYGIQMMSATDNSVVDITQVEKGLGLLTHKAGTEPPKPVNLVSVAPETFTLADVFKSNLEILSGINSVVRGQPDDNIRSGSAAALMNANATQFASRFVESHTLLIEQQATLTLEILQDYGDTERIISIVGPDRQHAVRKFTGGDLRDIRKVIVKVGSPQTATLFGRQQMADNLLQRGAISPQQYLEVMETGRLEPASGPAHSEFMLMQRENEAIRRGDNVPVLKTDNHVSHINHHMMEANHPDTRKDIDKIGALLTHVDEHYKVWRDTDPNELLARGIQPLEPQAPEKAAPMPQQGKGGQPAAQAQGGPPSDDEPGRPAGQMPELPNLPEAPTQ